MKQISVTLKNQQEGSRQRIGLTHCFALHKVPAVHGSYYGCGKHSEENWVSQVTRLFKQDWGDPDHEWVLSQPEEPKHTYVLVMLIGNDTKLLPVPDGMCSYCIGPRDSLRPLSGSQWGPLQPRNKRALQRDVGRWGCLVSLSWGHTPCCSWSNKPDSKLCCFLPPVSYMPLPSQEV